MTDHTTTIRTHLEETRDLLVALRLLLLDFNTPAFSKLQPQPAQAFSLDFTRFARSLRDGLNHVSMIVGYTQGLPARTRTRTTYSPHLTSPLTVIASPTDWFLDLPPRIHTLALLYHNLLALPSYAPLPGVPSEPGSLIVSRNAHRHVSGLLYHTAHSLSRAAATLPNEELYALAHAYIQEFPPNT